MAKIKPILFNTKMVRAILENRKTVTRRAPFQIEGDFSILKGTYFDQSDRLCALFHKPDDCFSCMPFYAPYQRGDVQYVREMWALCPDLFGEFSQYIYRADYSENDLKMGDDSSEYYSDFPACVKWRPSIYMPREAARIFLRVTGVKVERLHKITIEDIKKEGVQRKNIRPDGCKCAWRVPDCQDEPCPNRDFYEFLCWEEPFRGL